jgi:hypothetical protein
MSFESGGPVVSNIANLFSSVPSGPISSHSIPSGTQHFVDSDKMAAASPLISLDISSLTPSAASKLRERLSSQTSERNAIETLKSSASLKTLERMAVGGAISDHERFVFNTNLASSEKVAKESAIHSLLKFAEGGMISSDRPVVLGANGIAQIFTPKVSGQIIPGEKISSASNSILSSMERIRNMDSEGGATIEALEIMNSLPGRQHGGSVSAGSSYLVGEGGMPEVFMPDSSRFMNVNSMQSASKPNQNNHFDFRGSTFNNRQSIGEVKRKAALGVDEANRRFR